MQTSCFSCHLRTLWDLDHLDLDTCPTQPMTDCDVSVHQRLMFCHSRTFHVGISCPYQMLIGSNGYKCVSCNAPSYRIIGLGPTLPRESSPAKLDLPFKTLQKRQMNNSSFFISLICSYVTN